MFCYKCGEKLPDNSAFCTKCGAVQPTNDTATDSTSKDTVSEINVPAHFHNAVSADPVTNAQSTHQTGVPNESFSNQQTHSISTSASVENKSIKTPITIAAAAVVAVAAVVAAVIFFIKPNSDKGNEPNIPTVDLKTTDVSTTDTSKPSIDSDIEDAAEMLYNGTHVSKLLEYSSNEIMKTFGIPVSKGAGYLIYDDISFFFASSTGTMEGIKISAVNKISISDIPNKNLIELTEYVYGNTENLLEEELRVKPQMYVYPKGAFKFEYHLPLYSIFLVGGEYSSAPDSVWFTRNEPINDDEVRYNGISISTLLNMSYDDVIRVYGEPYMDPMNKTADNVLSYSSEDIYFEFGSGKDQIAHISNFKNEWITVNGVNIGENPDELNKIFGNPTENQGNIMSYNIYDYILDIYFDDSGETSYIKVSSLDSIPYNIEFLADFLGCTSEYVYDALGEPTGGTPVDGTLFFGGTEYYVYDEELSVLFNGNTPKTVYNVTVLPNKVEIDGVTLDKTRDELIALLGQPDSEDEYIDYSGGMSDYYFMIYALQEDDVQIKIMMDSIYSVASSIEITRIPDTRILEKHYSTGITAALHDLDNSLSAAEREFLLKYVDETAKNVGFSVGILITDDIGAVKTTEAAGNYGEQYYNDLFGVDADGIMYMCNHDTYDDYIFYYGRCEEIFTDNEIQEIFYFMKLFEDNFYDFLYEFCFGIEYYATN